MQKIKDKSSVTRSNPSLHFNNIKRSFFNDPKTFFGSNHVQPKLNIGKPYDAYEREADAVADKVVQRPASNDSVQGKSIEHTTFPLIQTKCAECEKEETLQKKAEDKKEKKELLQTKPIFESAAGQKEELLQRKCAECEKEEKLQRKENTSALSPSQSIEGRLSSSKGSGSPLPADIQLGMGDSMGADLSRVRIHTGQHAVQMNKNLNAQAFTHGSDIYFNDGKYDPNSNSGKHLLAHELTHTIQQSGGNMIKKQSQGGSTAIKEHGDLGQLPSTLSCPTATTSPTGGNQTAFDMSSAELSPVTKATIWAFIGRWHSSGANASVRIDGYASVDGTDDYNWTLSCNRAIAIQNEMLHPSNPAIAGIPASFITLFAHGETNRFSLSSLPDNRVVTITSTVPPPPPPTPEPEPDPVPTDPNKCGPDITSALSSLFTSVEAHFRGLSWFQKRRSCMALDVDAPFALVNPIMAWDTRQLFLPNTGFLDVYFTSHGCGSPRDPGCPADPTRHLCETTGSCGNTVLVGGKCMLAGTANYALYGKMFSLCNTEFSPDFPRWDMRAMINIYKTISFDDPAPPREMATSVFDGTYPTVPAVVENRGHCTGRCGQTHTGAFGFIWEPNAPR